jgi:VWFA-related protein
MQIRPVLLLVTAMAGMTPAAAADNEYPVKEVPIPSSLIQKESVRFVALDLVAERKLDGRWQWAAGITRDRVKLEVGNRELEIDVFESHCPAEGAPAPEVPAVEGDALEGTAAGRSPADAAGARNYVLYFDLQHLSMAANQTAFAAARQWAQQDFHPDDQVMIITSGLGLRVVRFLTPASDNLLEDLDRAEQDYGLTAGWAEGEGNFDHGRVHEIREWQEHNEGANASQSLADSYAADDYRYARKSLTNLEVLLSVLEAVEGTKNLVFFQETLRMYPGRQYQGIVPTNTLRPFVESLVESSNERNVRFYPVDAGGMDGESDEALHMLASETGGRFFTKSNDLMPTLEWIREDSACYYRIGFQDRPSYSGKVERIRVEIDGPRETQKYRMRHRRTLANPTREQRDTALVQAALMNPLRATDVPIQLSATALVAHAQGGRALVQMRVPMEALLPLPAGKRGEASHVLVQLAGMVVPLRHGAARFPEETSNVLADVATNQEPWSFQREALLKLPHSADQAMPEGHEVVLTRELDTPPGRYRVVAVVRDGLAQVLGAAATEFEIRGADQALGELHVAALGRQAHHLQPQRTGKRDKRKDKSVLRPAPATFPQGLILLGEDEDNPSPEMVYTVCGEWKGALAPDDVELQRTFTCDGQDVPLESPVAGRIAGAAGCSLMLEMLPPHSGSCRFEAQLRRAGSPVQTQAVDLPPAAPSKTGT